MRHGSSLWLTCLVTTCFLVGSGDLFAQKAGKKARKTPPLAIAPFDAAQANEHQKAWADHLGVPVKLRNSIGMKFVVIPPGEFMMGSPPSEPGRDDNETQRTVTIASPFSLDVHEVTQSQYESVTGSNPSHFRGVNNPVENVGWDDAVAFCRKLSALPAEVAAGQVYRLPTEAEWEYACRAGTTTAYSFGDDAMDLAKYAWFYDNSDNTPHAVGEKLPNGWALYDMHGNETEWCSDVDGSLRVVRSGGWVFDASYCWSAIRHKYDPTLPSFTHGGFRLALSSPSVQPPDLEPSK